MGSIPYPWRRRFSSLSGGNRHLSSPLWASSIIPFSSFTVVLSPASGRFPIHMNRISVQLKIPEGPCWAFQNALSMQFSPLLHSSLRTLAILASQDFHLCPLHPRKELRSSYTRTAAWKRSAGSKLKQSQVSSFVSNFSRTATFNWLLCNVLKKSLFRMFALFFVIL